MADKRPDLRALGNWQRLRMLATDTAVYGVAAAVNKSFALVLFPFLTRNLSVEDYGRLDLSLYVAMLLGLVIVWGQDSAVARLFFEDEQEGDRQRIISQALIIMAGNLTLVVAIVAVLLGTAPTNATFGANAPAMIFLVALLAPISALLSFCQSVLKWTFERNKFVLVALGMPAATLAGILILAESGSFGAASALAVMVGVSASFAALALWMIRRWLIIRPGFAFVGKLLPLSLPYGVIAAISAVSPVMERAVVSGRFGAEELGLYAAAAKIASLATMLAIAFQMGWGPFAYSIYKQDDAAKTYNLVLRVFAAIMCIAVLLLSAAGDPVTALLAGDRYRGAAVFVFPIAAAFGLQAIGWITELGIHLSKRTYLNLIGFTCFLVISLAGMFYLSRVIGMIGVPLGALGGQLVMLLVSAAVAQHAHRIAWDYRLPAASVLITFASGAAAMALPRTTPSAQAWWFYLGGACAVAMINAIFGLRAQDRVRLRALPKTITLTMRDKRAG